MTTKEERKVLFQAKNLRRRTVKKALGKSYADFRRFTTGFKSVIGSDGKPARAINGAFGKIHSPEIINTNKVFDQA
jgi:hypothetical protein